MNEKRRIYQRQYREQYKSHVKRVNLTLTQDEYQAFSLGAKGIKPTTHIKQLALAGLKNQTLIPPNLEKELQTLRFALRNIANNVNHMAHHSHIVQGMTTTDENNLLQHLKQLEEAINTYTEGRILDTPHDH